MNQQTKVATPSQQSIQSKRYPDFPVCIALNPARGLLTHILYVTDKISYDFNPYKLRTSTLSPSLPIKARAIDLMFSEPDQYSPQVPLRFGRFFFVCVFVNQFYSRAKFNSPRQTTGSITSANDMIASTFNTTFDKALFHGLNDIRHFLSNRPIRAL